MKKIAKTSCEYAKQKLAPITIKLADRTQYKFKGVVLYINIIIQNFKDIRKNVEVISLQKYNLIFGKPWIYDLNSRKNWKDNKL
ncbi:hypothetical protein C2G38_2210745 [Gigaspora rosea]|uniref:Uncharacterized protein n=1 Tax=Gigaspora rosea TaxID=44941 RepID=A0A397UF42_9GLOM|nr:hypothetical protein C2G38_2210745 [Gigaspora rosea]